LCGLGIAAARHGYQFNFEAVAQELYRVTKQGGVVVWIVGDQTIEGSESGTSFKQALYFKKIGFKIHDTMIYMKAGPSYPSQDKYYQVFEYMFVLSKCNPITFNPIKDRENRWYDQKWSKVRSRRNKEGVLKETTWTDPEGEKLGTRFNIWQYQVGYGHHGDEFAHKHPASFPEELAEDHILSWSNEGDTVLDCMMGSGTTGKMAHKHKRKFIGMEVSEEYFDIAKKRIIKAQLQLRMEL